MPPKFLEICVPTNLKFVVGWLALTTPLLGAVPARVTFHQHIAPIIYRECAPCHRPGESGPFPLLGYDDVKKHASQIAEVTKSRFMPPWLPEPGHGEFEEERRLTTDQIDLIQEWVKQGAVAGPTAGAPPSPQFTTEWQLGKPDLVLTVSHAYQLEPEGPEVFWNFVLPVNITSSKWVKAMEVRPGNPRVFHHANVLLDRSRTARRMERIPGAGFQGMDIAFEEESFDPDSHFLSWKPGSPPVIEPDGMAWRLDPGMDLVMNIHMKRTGKPELVNSSIGLYFTDKPQTKFAMLLQLEHDGAIDIPAGDKDFVVSDDFTAPMDLKVLALYPHAHYFAHVMECYATLPDGSRKWLIRIPNWDLNWQGVYRLKEPLQLPKGSVISMRYHYDNSDENPRNPNHPPKPIHGGNTALDEMSHFWLQVLPVSPEDQRPALQEALMRHRLEKYPRDFTANFNLGDLALSRDDTKAAVQFFENAAKAEPNSVLAATELGSALFAASRPAEAETQFKRALGIDAKYVDARYNLASVQASQGKWEQAASQYRQVVAERPKDQKAWQHLVEVLTVWAEELIRQRDFERASARYREALAYVPKEPGLHVGLGVALANLGKLAEAKTEFQSALSIDPNFGPARQALEFMDKQGSGK